MSEQFDKRNDAGFELYQKIDDVPKVSVGDTLRIGAVGNKQIKRKVKEIRSHRYYYDECIPDEYRYMPVIATTNNIIIGYSRYTD